MSGGWIGVDLDGTLAEDCPDTFPAIGAPVPLMVARVKAWLAEGREVRIVTARVGPCTAADTRPYKHGVRSWDLMQRGLIAAWCLEHLGQPIPITAGKDFRMLQLWDDRAVQVVPNTGQRADGR